MSHTVDALSGDAKNVVFLQRVIFVVLLKSRYVVDKLYTAAPSRSSVLSTECDITSGSINFCSFIEIIAIYFAEALLKFSIVYVHFPVGVLWTRVVDDFFIYSIR